MTAILVPFAAGTTVRPRPGVADEVLAGRTTRSELSRYSAISERLNAWFPSVMASMPAPRSRSARRGVIPMPSATFSPLATQASIPISARIVGRRASSAFRPGDPTTSAMKRMRRAPTLEIQVRLRVAEV
jgi:hypothetical protein